MSELCVVIVIWAMSCPHGDFMFSNIHFLHFMKLGAQNFQKLKFILFYCCRFFCGLMCVWMGEEINGSLDGWHTQATLSTRREYAYAIGARHLKLLLDYMLLCRRRLVLAQKTVPTPYCLAQFRICMLQSPIVEDCLVLHVTLSNVPTIFSPRLSSSARQHFL